MDHYNLFLQGLIIKEIHQDLMRMKSYKATGLNGFQPIFFTMLREDIGDDVRLFVKNAFEQGYMDSQSIESLMILILKKDNLCTFKEFKPISICNVACKLESKFLVNRIVSLISAYVSSFVL